MRDLVVVTITFMCFLMKLYFNHFLTNISSSRALEDTPKKFVRYYFSGKKISAPLKRTIGVRLWGASALPGSRHAFVGKLCHLS